MSSSDLWKQADIEKQQIFDLMDKVQAKLQKKYGKSNQVLTTNVRKATWCQVLDQVNTTAQQWSQSRKASNVSLSIDKIGRNSDAFQAWLQLLPGGDYGSRCVSPFFLFFFFFITRLASQVHSLEFILPLNCAMWKL